MFEYEHTSHDYDAEMNEPDMNEPDMNEALLQPIRDEYGFDVKFLLTNPHPDAKLYM